MQLIVQTLRTAPKLPIYFTKLDLHRFFDSLVLPRRFYHPFLLQYQSTTYEYLRLPFGWANAPHTAQRFAEQIVRSAMHSSTQRHWARTFVYLDDWLIASTSRSTCESICRNITSTINNLNLILNTSKSVTTPTTEIAALGAQISASTQLEVRPLDTKLFTTITNLLHKPLTITQMYRIAGSLLWRDPKVLPYLTPIYTRAAHRIPGLLSRTEVRLITAAASAAARGTLCPGVWETLPYPTVITRLQQRLIFCDASASRQLAAILLPNLHFRRYKLPSYIIPQHIDRHRRQQCAELYALYRALQYALNNSPSTPTIIISDSTSALWSTIRFSAGITNPIRASILRRISSLVHRTTDYHITFAYLQTQLHPADPLTFNHYSLHAVTTRLHNISMIHPPPGRPSRPSLRPSSIISSSSGATNRHISFDASPPIYVS